MLFRSPISFPLLLQGYSMTDWREDVKRVLLSAGIKDKPTTFLFSDVQVRIELQQSFPFFVSIAFIIPLSTVDHVSLNSAFFFFVNSVFIYFTLTFLSLILSFLHFFLPLVLRLLMSAWWKTLIIF